MKANENPFWVVKFKRKRREGCHIIQRALRHWRKQKHNQRKKK